MSAVVIAMLLVVVLAAEPLLAAWPARKPKPRVKRQRSSAPRERSGR